MRAVRWWVRGQRHGDRGRRRQQAALTARPLEIMRLTALPPPPPQPTTLMRASPARQERR